MDYVKEQTKYILIIIDEFGLIKMETQQIHDLLTIKEWYNYFSDTILSNSILDRLFSNSHIVEMEGELLKKADCHSFMI